MLTNGSGGSGKGDSQGVLRARTTPPVFGFAFHGERSQEVYRPTRSLGSAGPSLRASHRSPRADHRCRRGPTQRARRSRYLLCHLRGPSPRSSADDHARCTRDDSGFRNEHFPFLHHWALGVLRRRRTWSALRLRTSGFESLRALHHGYSRSSWKDHSSNYGFIGFSEVQRLLAE